MLVISSFRALSKTLATETAWQKLAAPRAGHDMTATEPPREVERYPIKNPLATRTTENVGPLGRKGTRSHSAVGGCCTTGACSSSRQAPGSKTLAGRGRRDCLARFCRGVPAALGDEPALSWNRPCCPASMHTVTVPSPARNSTCCLSQTSRNVSHGATGCPTASHSSQREGPGMT